jgi:hypothetical protein
MARTLKTYDPIIALLRDKLLANPAIAEWDKWVDGEPIISPRYLDYPDNATYPCITIYRDYGICLKNRTGHEEGHYFIHGWLKQFDDGEGGSSDVVDDCSYLMNMVISTLSDDRVLGRQVTDVDMCRVVDSRCPCYEAQSRTYFFMTDWRIIYDSMMMYEFE